MNRRWRLDDFTPVGVNPGRELGWLAGAGLVCLLFSLGFAARLHEAVDSLYWMGGSGRELMEGIKMPEFQQLLAGSLSAFHALAGAMVLLAAWHLVHHTIGSQSIYLMRRLPDRWELVRRCLSLPLAGAVAAVAAGALLRGLYYLIYLASTPPGYLP